MSNAAEWLALSDAVAALPEGAVAALATLTRTHGSAFRHTGTRMLVHANGRAVCELSGGCPQRDIVTRARAVIADGKPLRVAYNAESGLDVLMEMGCGGEPSTCPTAAVISNAVYDAVGVRLRQKPFRAERVKAALDHA